MIVESWRIVQSAFAAQAFSGEGAKVAGGRWNSRGHPVVYTAGSASLAMLEMLVHLQKPALLETYCIHDLKFDDRWVQPVAMSDLPADWQAYPAPLATQRIGDDWISSATTAVLRVPSVINPLEWNYLINPMHKDFHRIKIGPQRAISFDPRLKD